MRRRLGLLLIVFMILFAGGYSTWWYVLVRQLQSGVAAWAVARRAEGWTVSIGTSHVGGWPRAARVELADVALRGGAPELPFDFTWTASTLDLQLAPFDPRTLLLLPKGEQQVGLATARTLSLMAPVWRISLRPDRREPPWPIGIRAEDLRVRSAAAESVLVGRLSARLRINPAAVASDPALAARVEAERIEVPANSRALGERIEALSADATVSGPVPPAGSPAARARSWRDGGGAASLEQGRLHWGPLRAEMTARVTLDTALQPLGGGRAQIGGWAPALDLLAAHGVITDHAAVAAKAVISLLAEAPPGGGRLGPYTAFHLARRYVGGERHSARADAAVALGRCA